jgi:alpha-1,2-mannosyltransferase
MSAPGRTGHKWPAALGFVLLVAALGACFWDLLAPFDLLTFIHAGRAVLDGRSPYSPVDSALFQSGHAFVYPAFVAWLFVPLAVVPQSVAVDVFAAGSVAAIAVACRWLGRTDDRAAMLLLVSAPTIIALQMGTLNPLLLLGIAASWRLRNTRPLASGALLGVVAATKLFLLPLLLWPLLRNRRAFAPAAATVLVAFAVQAPLGRSGFAGYESMLSKLQGSEAARSWSLASLLQSLGLDGHGADALVLAAGAVAAIALWRWRAQLSDGHVLGFATLIGLLISPIVWSSYLLLAAVPLLLFSRGHRALVVAAAAGWLLVTPDAASPARVVAGVALAVITIAVMASPGLRLPRPPVNATRVATVLAVIGAAAVLVVVPPGVRNALPALLALLLLASWGATKATRPNPV